MEEFIYNLKLSQGLKPSSFKEIHFSIVTNIIKALIFILPSLFLLNKMLSPGRKVEELILLIDDQGLAGDRPLFESLPPLET